MGLEARFTLPNPSVTAITHAKDGSGRLFVTTQNGNVYVFDGSVVRTSPFLSVPTSASGELGLLGLAFHPSYVANGFFYVYYTAFNGDSVVARYTVSTTDPNRADPASARILFTVAHSSPIHRGGQLAFGPDGFLYVSIGDGGDRSRAPNLTTLAGKILRIDVDTTDGSPYRIPPGNPFAGQPPARPEIWAFGVRNPWRFSFDRLTGTFFLPDVGENRYEEVNVTPGGFGGQNYGWPRMEGPFCFEPASGCNDGTLTLPNFGYGHDSTGGCSITGGFRYRGLEFPEFDGIYFYGDLCSGRLFGATESTGSWVGTELLRPFRSFSTFGEDEAGEVYAADYNFGIVFRVVSTFGPTIRINDPAPVAESAGEAVFEVSLSAPSDRTVSVRYAVNGASSVQPQQGQVVFSPGETQKLLRVQILDDAVDEPSALVFVTLSDPVRGTIADAQSQVTILDDDPPPVVSVSDCSVLESDTGTFCVFTVSLSIRSGLTTRVDSATLDGTAVQDLDYTRRQETLLFDPGQTTVTVRVAIRGDVVFENDETFFVNLTARPDSNLTIGDGQGQGTILNDDTPPPTDAPAPIAPTGVINTALPIFSWTAVNGASRYLLAVDAPGAGSVMQTEFAAATACSGSMCSAALSLALPERAYEWRVSGGNKTGFGPSSAVVPFQTDLPAHLIMSKAGTGTFGFNGDGRLAFTAQLSSPVAVVADAGNVLIGEQNRIRRVESGTEIITTIAGNGTFGCTGDGVPAVSSPLASVTSLASDSTGNVYIATSTVSSCSQVSRIDGATGVVTRVAGNLGPQGFGGDGGPARNAGFSGPIYGLDIDGAGNVLISDTFSRRVRRVDAVTGIITTIAGGGAGGGSDDGGPATAATLLSPTGIAVDAAGNLYIADSLAHRIRRVDAATGIISVAVGDGVAGFAGDGGPAPVARINGPRGIAVDAGGSLWIADTNNNRVRLVDIGRGTIVSFAGNGLSTGAAGDGGPPRAARLRTPYGVALDSMGNLFIAEQGDNRVRTIDNHVPLAAAGSDVELEAGEPLTLDGASSSDADGDPLDLEWREDGALLGTGAVVTPSLAAGTHVITLLARDGQGGNGRDEVTVVVRPATPPTVSITSPRDASITAGVPLTIEWTASDDGALAGFDVRFAADGGAYGPVPACTGLPGSARSCTWDVPGPVTSQAALIVEARDRAGHSGTDESHFRIVSPYGTGTGLRGEYYDRLNLRDLVLVRTDPTVDFDWRRASPAPGIRPNLFSVRWTGLVEPRFSETYTFHAQVNDGVRLWIDGLLVIDHWTSWGPSEQSGSIALEAGRKYVIRLEYQERLGAASIRFFWSSPSEPKQIVPRTQLYPSP